MGLVVVWMSQHEGNLMKLAAGCPLVEVQWTLLQYSLHSFSIILLGSYIDTIGEGLETAHVSYTFVRRLERALREVANWLLIGL